MLVRGVLVEPGKPPLEAEIETQYMNEVIGEHRVLIRPFKDREVGGIVREDYSSDATGLKYNRSIGSFFKSVAVYGPMFVAALEVDGSLLPLNDDQVKQYLKILSK